MSINYPPYIFTLLSVLSGESRPFLKQDVVLLNFFMEK